MKSEKTKVLLLAANPIDTTPLQLDEEVRAIDKALQLSQLREHIELVSHWAVRIDDLIELLLRHRPTFIHFSGHGSPDDRIILQDATERSVEIDEHAFAEALRIAGKTAKCVFLNACYSELQANLIAEFVPAVIGVSGEILDEAATIFAKTLAVPSVYVFCQSNQKELADKHLAAYSETPLPWRREQIAEKIEAIDSQLRKECEL